MKRCELCKSFGRMYCESDNASLCYDYDQTFTRPILSIEDAGCEERESAEGAVLYQIFIQTGYPLDLPSGSLGSYCIYEYHMPCSMGFATGGKTFFLWGGCMMARIFDL
ncbi:hypothetical protein LXL04_004374 [Taraxacum kok-saghyz]